MAGTHSILAPSGSSRWLRCVGSLYLSKGITEPDKEHSASGTLSHALLEWALNNPDKDLDTWLGVTETTDGFKFKIDEERIERVRACVTAINREPGTMLTETLLDTAPVLGVPRQSGHSDVIKAYPEGGVVKDGVLLKGVLSVHDFKDGFKLVNARDNTQGLIYLCAAMFQLDLIGDFSAFRFCIHQPKIHHYDEWTYSRAELLAFMEAIRPLAKLAYDLYHGTVEFDPKLHLNAGEEQCSYCPVRGRCVARAHRIAAMFEPMIRRHELDDASIGILLAQVPEIKAACADFEDEAFRRAKLGVEITDHKLVYGSKGRRAWADKVTAELVMRDALGEDAYEPREIISPTEAERKLKKRYEPLKQYVTQSEPQLRLVHATAKGEAVKIQGFEPVKESLI